MKWATDLTTRFTTRFTTRIATRLARATSTLNRIIGAPDYEGYLQHQRVCHPEHAPLTKDEFVKQRLEDRYSRPGARCC